VANYQTRYRLLVVSDPPEGAAFRCEPPSADWYFPADSEVTVTVEPKPGYKFRWWEGELRGGPQADAVQLWKPASALAVLERVPYIAPTGVRNAAGETPDSALAPGSIIAITGANLAPAYERGPDSPLAQTLAGIAVEVGGRALPLFFVSPEQINAQLLSDLEEGEYTLAVKSETGPDVTAPITIRRNAPGLFTQEGEPQGMALAMRSDGAPVTGAKPAELGEIITLLGTGLGPYQQGAFDGFIIPEGFELRLADPVEIRVGDNVIQPLSATAAIGFVGVTAIRFRVGEELPAAATVELRVAVNGRESNTVLLPLK
jgi:uncharacterized protein (TIGR03437 family)